MKKYELIAELEVTPEKSKKLINDFLNHFNEWDKYEDEFIGEEKIKILNDKNKWNESYLRKHIALLSSNFSKERLEHIKEIIEYLYPYEIEEQKESILKKKLVVILGIILIGLVLIFLIIFSGRLHQTQPINQMNQHQTKKDISKNIKQVKMKDKKQTITTVREKNQTIKVINNTINQVTIKEMNQIIKERNQTK